MQAGTEKINATINAVKESEKATDEKVQRITESLGEIRALIFGKESKTKDQQFRLEKLEEEVAGINPRKIEKEFGKRDRILTDIGMRTEKIESKMEALVKNVGAFL